MTLRHKLILFSLSGLLLSGNTPAQWIREKSPVTCNLNSIFLTDSVTGWIAGDNGTIMFRENNEWKLWDKVTDEHINSVFMLNKSEGWAVGSKGIILHFYKGRWEKTESPTRNRLNSVSFSDSLNGVAAGENGTLIIYRNGTWELSDNRIDGYLHTVSSGDGVTMVGGSLESMSLPVMKLTENNTLVKSFDPGYIGIKCIAIRDRNNIWATGYSGVVFHYNGLTWKRLYLFEKLSTLNSISFSDENKGVAAGYCGTILTCSGDTWTMEESHVTEKLNGAAVYGRFYYAVGNNGTIVSHQPHTETAPGAEDVKIADNQIIVYPNPSSSNLNISIPEGPVYQRFTIIITDTEGRTVYKKDIPSVQGGHVYQLNTAHLRNGLYLIRLIMPGNISRYSKFIVNH